MRTARGGLRGTAAGSAPAAGRTPSDAFRQYMSSYFTGVSVVTAVDAEGRPHGLTCSSLTSVTLRPPTLQVCLDTRSGTLAALRVRGSFAVNLLRHEGRRAAEVFASGRRDRFEQTAWHPSALYGLPRLSEDAYAVAECRLSQLVVIGDHAAVFGQVMNVENGAGRPLLYGRREFWGPPHDGARVPSDAGTA